MSAAPKTTRAPRGRILVVGPHPLDEALARGLRERPLHARDLYEAMGEISAAHARHPIVAALIHDEELPEPARATAALRRLDPAVRLIRVTNGSGPPPAGDGFDGCLAAPFDASALARALGEDDAVLPQEAPPETPPVTRTGALPTAAPVPPALRPHAAGFPPAAPPMPASAPAAPQAAELGDTSLLDAVINDPAGVLDTAIRLMRQQTGWHDLDLRPAGEPAPPPGRVAAAVTVGGAPRGALSTALTRPEYLAAWAEWLGRWLLLDEQFRNYRSLAFRDELTGAWNRRYFNRFLAETIEVARERRRQVSVMVFDIDDFKRYNDEFNHEAGDVILCETVALLESVIRSCDRVCRIGGDEFAVIFADLDAPRELGSSHPASAEGIARRFQEQISAMRFPKLGRQARGSLTISAGLATFPWDGHDATSLLRLADQRALESKRRGKNHITFGPGTESGG